MTVYDWISGLGCTAYQSPCTNIVSVVLEVIAMDNKIWHIPNRPKKGFNVSTRRRWVINYIHTLAALSTASLEQEARRGPKLACKFSKEISLAPA